MKIDGNINKKAVNANLSAISKNTSITARNAKLNFETDAINAYLNLKVKNDELGFYFKGKSSSPSISLDAQKATKTILNHALGKEKTNALKDKAKNAINKALGNSTGDSADSGKKIEQKIGDSLKKLFNK